jgi:hypothetical protein
VRSVRRCERALRRAAARGGGFWGAILAITALAWAFSQVHIADGHPPYNTPETRERS